MKFSKDFISLKNLSKEQIIHILELSQKIKSEENETKPLSDKKVALVFEKPSNRTRVSFEVAIVELGGYPIYLDSTDIKLGARESVKDIAKTLSRYVDAIVARTFSHDTLIELAKHADISVINGLSDFSHPAQAMGDIFTIKEKFGTFDKIKLAFIGDGNNVLNSLLYASSKIGLNLHIATPAGYQPPKEVFDYAVLEAKKNGSEIILTDKPEEAAKNANIIYTDVWTSMGQENENEIRKKAFKNFQINNDLVLYADKECLIMHCLPAHRGEEITDDVIDGVHSIVFDQAENRLHVQKAILSCYVKG